MLYSSLIAPTPSAVAPPLGWTSSLSVILDPRPLSQRTADVTQLCIPQVVDALYDYAHVAWWEAPPLQHNIPNAPLPGSSLLVSLHTITRSGALSSPIPLAALNEEALQSLRTVPSQLHDTFSTLTQSSEAVASGSLSVDADHVAAISTVLQSLSSGVAATSQLRHHHHILLVTSNGTAEQFIMRKTALENQFLNPLVAAGRSVSIVVLNIDPEMLTSRSARATPVNEFVLSGELRFINISPAMCASTVQRSFMFWTAPQEQYGHSQLVKCNLHVGDSGLHFECEMTPTVLSHLPRLAVNRLLPGSSVSRPASDGSLVSSPYQLPASWAVSGQPPVLTAERIAPMQEIDESLLWGTAWHCVPTPAYRTWWLAFMHSLGFDGVMVLHTTSTATFLPCGTLGVPSCEVVALPSADFSSLLLRAMIPLELRRVDQGCSHQQNVQFIQQQKPFMEQDLLFEMSNVVDSLKQVRPMMQQQRAQVATVIGHIATSSAQGKLQGGKASVTTASRGQNGNGSHDRFAVTTVSVSNSTGAAAGAGGSLLAPPAAGGRKTTRNSFRIPIGRGL